LPHNGALEGDEHEERKEGIVPILVEHPQADTEDLEDKERGDGMFPEKFGEGGNRDIKGVGAIVLFEPRQFSLCSDASALLELVEEGFGFGVDFVGQGAEGLLDGIVEKAPLLE
jgi:hypothetical protein